MYNAQYARASRQAARKAARHGGHAEVMVGMVRHIQTATQQLVKRARGCPTQIETLLDEIGLHDNAPWPNAVCQKRAPPEGGDSASTLD